MTVAIVLAAGRSSRMGRSKALLPHPITGTSFAVHAIRTAREGGVGGVVVVGRPGDAPLAAQASAEAATFVINEQPERGQLSSLLAGLDAAEGGFDAHAVLVMPVDVPFVSAAGVRHLLDEASSAPAAIVRATRAGRHGHPVVFKRAVFDELRQANPDEGARAVVHADPRRVLDVELPQDDPAFDVDTPEDYRKACGRRP